MAKYIQISLILLAIACNQLFSQTISFERTDVEGKRANFVTATFSFGIDIRIDSIAHCSNVAFELSHNKTSCIKYSGMKISEDWGLNSVNHIVQLDVDTNTDIARIVVEAGTGLPADSNSPDNPKIIHLDFVVNPNAIHGEIVDFTLSKVRATVFMDSAVKLVIPNIPKFSYRIHSYIDVWPGDTDNNGEVNAIDHALISQYLLEPYKTRAFKRNPTSTLWQPQQVIAWDTLAATYVDCDGNGVITNSDHSVVIYNMGKSWAVVPQVQNATFHHTGILKTENTICLPIHINTVNEKLLGIAGTIDVTAYSNCKLTGIESIENPFVHYLINADSTRINFVIGNNDYINSNDVVGYLYLEAQENAAISEIGIDDFVGFTENGNIINLEHTPINNSIDNVITNVISISYSNELLYLSCNSKLPNKITLIDCLGKTIAEYEPASANNVYRIGHLPAGIYFVLSQYFNKTGLFNLPIIE